MTIVQHIQELRKRLILALAGIFVGTIVGFIWYQVSFTIGAFRLPFTSLEVGPWHIWSLGDILTEPYCKLDASIRFAGTEECRLIATSPFEMFLLRLKVGALAGMVLSSPWWLYQIWAFITPGLVRKERRITLIAVSLAAFLFILGSILAYVVIAYGLDFLLQVGSSAQVPLLTGASYFGFLLGLILVFGVSFEVPLFIAMMNAVGILPYEAVKDKRRIIIILLFIFAAFMTPGQEPYSMVALAICLTLLVEVALQFCRINDKRRNRERPQWLDAADDESSGPIAAAGSIGSVGGIDAPAPVGAPTPVTAASDVSVRASAPPPGTSTIARTQPVAPSAPPAAPQPIQPQPGMRPTRNSRPAPPVAPRPAPTQDLRQRPVSDFDDVL